MSQLAAAIEPTNYRVEVSGWDASEAFFLEKTVLYWNSSKQEVPLRSRLREGAVVFVRLLQPFESDENFPVPYLVSKNLPIEIDGRVTVEISRRHPKPSYRHSVFAMKSSKLTHPLDNDSSFVEAIGGMGLKLRQTTGPVKTFIIDHPEKASPN